MKKIKDYSQTPKTWSSSNPTHIDKINQKNNKPPKLSAHKGCFEKEVLCVLNNILAALNGMVININKLNKRMDKMATQQERLLSATVRLQKEVGEAITLIRKLLTQENPDVETAITTIDSVSTGLNEFTPENPPPEGTPIIPPVEPTP